MDHKPVAVCKGEISVSEAFPPCLPQGLKSLGVPVAPNRIPAGPACPHRCGHFGQQAGERFAVRNSGAMVVVEGCGANGCEYMTGGTAVVLGAVGQNFGAGMTGGMAFVYDPTDIFRLKVNPETVAWQRIDHPHWENVMKELVEEHVAETKSPLGARLLNDWDREIEKVWQVVPKEMLSRLPVPLSTAKAKTA